MRNLLGHDWAMFTFTFTDSDLVHSGSVFSSSSHFFCSQMYNWNRHTWYLLELPNWFLDWWGKGYHSVKCQSPASKTTFPCPGRESNSFSLGLTNILNVVVKVNQSCPTLWDPMDYTVLGIHQARILEWVTFLFSRGSSQPRDRTQVSRIAGRLFTRWATREVTFWIEVFFSYS